MNPNTQVLLGLGLVSILAGTAWAEAVRPGNQIKVRLEGAFNATSAHSGDGFPVTVPDGLQIDPKGSPVIPAGTRGTALFRLLEKTPTGLKYDVSSFLFDVKGRRIEIKTGFPAGDQTTGMLPMQKASAIKKALLPPLLGFLIWKDKAVLPAGKDLVLEVNEEKRW